jgi:hypothetical protein
MTIPIPPGEDFPPGTLPGPDPRESPPPPPVPLPGPDPTTDPPIRPGVPDARPPSLSDSEEPSTSPLTEIDPDPGNKAGLRDTAGDRHDHV